jgi:hypothetical protein
MANQQQPTEQPSKRDQDQENQQQVQPPNRQQTDVQPDDIGNQQGQQGQKGRQGNIQPVEKKNDRPS